MAKRWWVQKYQTPIRPFHKMSFSGLMIEMYEDMWATRDELVTEAAEAKGDKSAIYKRIAQLNEALGDEDGPTGRSVDPLIDKWERLLAEGKPIDLQEWRK